MKRIIMLAAACAVSLPAFAQTVATVNDKPVTQKDVDQFVQALVSQGQKDTPQVREQVKQELINRQVFMQAADAAGVSKKPEVQAEIELSRQTILVRALMANYLASHPVTDSQINALYNEIKKDQTGKVEYETRHILVPDQKTADSLLAQLQKDKNKFSEFAKKYSKDTGSAGKGGDLGWSPADSYAAPFADALKQLKKGQIADKPIQTQFGWHIVMLQDTRPIKIPTLADSRRQVEQLAQQQALADYQQELIKKATIK